MIPGVNPRQLRQAMKKMGMEQEELDAIEVIIKTKDKNIIIKNPNVAKVSMMGEESFQVSGKIVEQDISSEPDVSEEDIETVVEQTGCSRSDAEKAIRENKGDLAQTILELQERIR